VNINWGAIWEFVWPVLKQAVIAFLVALLALLRYDGSVLPRRLRSFAAKERQAGKGR
jgi:hypothetical protein